MALTSSQHARPLKLALPRMVLWAAIGGSIALHIAFIVAVMVFRWDPFQSRGPVTDVPTETQLTLTAPPVPHDPTTVAATMPTPPSPTVPQPEPEPVPVAASDVLPSEVTPPRPTPTTIDAKPSQLTPMLPSAAAPIVPIRETPEQDEPLPVTFAGDDGARAKRVVYVVDASGAMASSLRFIKTELVQSLARLDASQTFQIIVVRDPPGSPKQAQVDQFSPGSGLLKADSQTRIRVASWLEGIQPGGSSDPVAGLTAAMKLHPDAVFLLTRSIRRSGSSTEWGAGNAATLATINQLNPADKQGRRPATIKAIQFLDEDPTGLLQEVGKLHGSYRVLPMQDLTKGP